MTRLPLSVWVCLLVVAVAGVGAVGGAGPRAPVDAATDRPSTTVDPNATPDRSLVVADAETGERLLTTPVTEGTTVALNYTHSVEKTPVLDVYAVNGTELEMVRMEFRSYGAGLPARADVNVTDDGTFVFDPSGSYDHIYVQPGEIAGHELLVADRTYDLVGLSSGRSVKLLVTNASGTPTDT
nr:DUF1850 domain-containing protein [Halorussus marinus]